MDRLKKAKAKASKRAALITAKNKGYRNGIECYRPYSGATNGLRTDEMIAYKLGYDLGFNNF